jgi:hypothetical protein
MLGIGNFEYIVPVYIGDYPFYNPVLIVYFDDIYPRKRLPGGFIGYTPPDDGALLGCHFETLK